MSQRKPNKILITVILGVLIDVIVVSSIYLSYTVPLIEIAGLGIGVALVHTILWLSYRGIKKAWSAGRGSNKETG